MDPAVQFACATGALSWSAIHALQVLAATIGAAAVWTACRRGLNPDALVVIAAAAFLATPHGFLYDMPALLAAVTLLLTGQRTGRTMLVAALLLLVLAVMAAVHVLPFAGPPLMGLLAIGCMPGSSRPSRRAHTSRGQGATPSLQDTTVGI